MTNILSHIICSPHPPTKGYGGFGGLSVYTLFHYEKNICNKNHRTYGKIMIGAQPSKTLSVTKKQRLEPNENVSTIVNMLNILRNT